MIRNFLKEESQLEEGDMKFERKKIVGMKSSKIKDKNIIGASMVMAEEIIKSCLFRTNDVNTQIYNSLIVFDNLDQNDGNIFYDGNKFYDEKNEKNDKKFSDEKTSKIGKISNILNLEENEELSNYCQLKSVNNLFFPSITENKFNNTIAKLFEDFKIAKEKEKGKEKGNISLSRNTGTINSQDLKTEFLQSEIFTPSRSNININITHAQSPVKASDSSLELVSLQEYLKRESDRLKNDQDYLNYKSRKESLMMKEQREEQLMKEILNMKTTTMNTPSSIIQQFQLQKKNKSLNLLKNKNFVNVKKGKLDTAKDKNNNYNPALKKDSFNSLHQNSTQLNKNYKQSNSLRNFYISPSDTKRNTKIDNIHNTILHSPTNKSTSKSKFLNITNHTIVNTCPDSNRFNKKVIVPKMAQSRNINFSNTKIKLNFSPKKGSNPISPNNLSVNNTINMRERERENQTLTTKTTSRPSSYSRQAMKNLNINNVNNVNNVMPMSNEKNENIFKIDLSRKNSGKNFKSNNVINERYHSDDMENFVVDLRDKPVIPEAMASIKIDIRELLQEGDDKSEDQSILKTQENYNDKSYSDILHTENYQNASNAWNSKELEDLIIVKQTVDKNGRIVI
jgi:hypothetical protein